MTQRPRNQKSWKQSFDIFPLVSFLDYIILYRNLGFLLKIFVPAERDVR